MARLSIPRAEQGRFRGGDENGAKKEPGHEGRAPKGLTSESKGASFGYRTRFSTGFLVGDAELIPSFSNLPAGAIPVVLGGGGEAVEALFKICAGLGEAFASVR
jgi:hypothetical protein